jgi:hypothetical protein
MQRNLRIMKKDRQDGGETPPDSPLEAMVGSPPPDSARRLSSLSGIINVLVSGAGRKSDGVMAIVAAQRVYLSCLWTPDR